MFLVGKYIAIDIWKVTQQYLLNACTLSNPTFMTLSYKLKNL